MSTLLWTLFKTSVPYVIAGIAGFGLAFGIQELRLTDARQEFAQYKIDQQILVQRHIDFATTQREKASDDFLQAQEALEKSISDGEVYRRCVAAGKCGVRDAVSSCTSAGVQATGESDGIRPNAVPAAGGDAALNECAQTTLMLNKLQGDIENQEGYNPRSTTQGE